MLYIVKNEHFIVFRPSKEELTIRRRLQGLRYHVNPCWCGLRHEGKVVLDSYSHGRHLHSFNADWRYMTFNSQQARVEIDGMQLSRRHRTPWSSIAVRLGSHEVKHTIWPRLMSLTSLVSFMCILEWARWAHQIAISALLYSADRLATSLESIVVSRRDAPRRSDTGHQLEIDTRTCTYTGANSCQ